MLKEITKKPWGSWEMISSGDGWQVKILRFIPGGALSLQRHQHRSESWCVASGTGKAYVAGTGNTWIYPGDTVSVPNKVAHRIENTGSETLVVVETQYGDYLGEDDLERLEDAYGRTLGKVDPAND
ncbi:MAG: phosphomannose isomerase type II C-terminal cupin domain [Chloroflexi bacterium]|nr:phosphomannose isomerase type II C-terminal cupin domain [Chloroflexota bacterium]